MEKYAKCIFPKTQDASQVGNAFTEVAGFISKWSTSEGVSRVFLRLNVSVFWAHQVVISVLKGVDSDIDKLALGFVKSFVYPVTSPQLVALSHVRASHCPMQRKVCALWFGHVCVAKQCQLCDELLEHLHQFACDVAQQWRALPDSSHSVPDHD